MNVLSIDGTALTGIYVDASLAFNKPAKNVDMIAVPGRNGSLAVDYGTFKNVTISYPVIIKSNFPSDFQALINKLAALKGYHRIECSNDTDHYRIGRFIMPETPTVRRINREGRFNLSFDCKPQRFLKTGEDPYPLVSNEQTLLDENNNVLQDENGNDLIVYTTDVTTIVNPTEWPSRPLIRATGPGDINIGNQVIHVSVSESITVYIDCESMEIYRLQGSTPVNMSQSVVFSTLDFPVINPGSQALGHTMPIQIIPRWWRL